MQCVTLLTGIAPRRANSGKQTTEDCLDLATNGYTPSGFSAYDSMRESVRCCATFVVQRHFTHSSWCG